MKAAIYTRYGPPEVLEIKEVPKPVCGDLEMIIKVRATTVTAGDYRMRAYKVPPLFWLPGRIYAGLLRPKRPILGTELAGVVEAVGKNVSRYNIGEAVFGSTGAQFGAYAEYVCLPEDSVLALKPDHVTFEQAAAVPFGSLAALFFLRDQGKLQPGHNVLVNGASGGVGSAAVQIARSLGARVTGVCSTANIEMVRSLGAANVVDYTQTDVTRGHGTFDLILDTVGNLPVLRAKRILRNTGVLVTAVIGLPHVVQMVWTSVTGGKKVIGSVVSEKIEDFLFLASLVREGRIKPFIDRAYPFDQIAEAHRYAENGHKRGNVVITLS